ncbi:MAG: hypothetical protein HQL13_06010 [Candidatus Omnitrophica bacterium]|nr:hypothetical protein [Candidatus Omnitrophota bacterium]
MNQQTHLRQEQEHPGKYVDLHQLELLVCLEVLMATCYQALSWSVHNQVIRKECQHFEQHARYHQEELRKMFSLAQDSEVLIETKVNQYLLQWKPSSLTLREVINLIINLNFFRTDIYKSLFHTMDNHQERLKCFLEDTAEEMHFLSQERIFHENRLEEYLKVKV